VKPSILIEAEDLLRRGCFEWSDDDDAYRHRRFLITRKELADSGLLESTRPRLLTPQKKEALNGLEMRISLSNRQR